MIRKYIVAVVIGVLTLCCLCEAGGLAAYVAAPDASFKWQKVSESNTITGKTTLLSMTSQTWQGIEWKHEIEVVIPAKCDYPKTAILFITGGHPGGGGSQVPTMLAASAGCPVAVLYEIPNQPLFGGLSEDDLIAHTFVKCMETGDATWPALLPMTKAAVKAMDVVREFSKSIPGGEITGFVVSGASKRGWTTWLTAAADPIRVKGIAPIVYDNLNLAAQMSRQLKCYGHYSDRIEPYTSRKVQEKLQTPAGRQLAALVDPWDYRTLITMPKLIVNGTNDPYWTADSLNIYWNGLRGSKYVTYVPNGGHDMSGANPVDVMKAINTCAAFARAIAAGARLPDVSWKYSFSKTACQLKTACGVAGSRAKLWTASSDTLDFRKSKWESRPANTVKGGFSGEVALPSKGYTAVMEALTVPVGDREWSLSTQIQVIDSKGACGSGRNGVLANQIGQSGLPIAGR